MDPSCFVREQEKYPDKFLRHYCLFCFDVWSETGASEWVNAKIGFCALMQIPSYAKLRLYETFLS